MVHMVGVGNDVQLSVKEQVRDAARDVKDDHGESWNDVIRFYAEHRDGLSLSDGGDVDVDTGELAAALAEHIDYAETQDAESVVARIDELESRLPEKVGSELEGRFR